MCIIIYAHIFAGVNHDELVRIAEQQFTHLPCSTPSLPTLTPCRFTGCEMRVRNDDMPFAHIAMAVEVRLTWREREREGGREGEMNLTLEVKKEN